MVCVQPLTRNACWARVSLPVKTGSVGLQSLHALLVAFHVASATPDTLLKRRGAKEKREKSNTGDNSGFELVNESSTNFPWTTAVL